MEMLFAAIGILGALSCVGMYAAVSLGHASTERPPFFIINGGGALLIMIATWHNFDIGDVGTILQEIIWMGLSIAGGLRVWRFQGQRKAQRSRPAQRPVLHPVQSAPARQKHREGHYPKPAGKCAISSHERGPGSRMSAT